MHFRGFNGANDVSKFSEESLGQDLSDMILSNDNSTSNIYSFVLDTIPMKTTFLSKYNTSTHSSLGMVSSQLRRELPD